MTDILVKCNTTLEDRYSTEEDWNEINVSDLSFSVINLLEYYYLLYY